MKIDEAGTWERGGKPCVFLKACAAFNPLYHPILTDTVKIGGFFLKK